MHASAKGISTVHLHGKPVLMHDPTGWVQSDVRLMGIQHTNKRFQGHLCLQQNMLICADEYADL